VGVCDIHPFRDSVVLPLLVTRESYFVLFGTYLFIYIFCFCLQTGSHFVTQAGPELSVWPRLAWNFFFVFSFLVLGSNPRTHVCYGLELLNAGIIGAYYSQLILFF
jgi:hypothetical protein